MFSRERNVRNSLPTLCGRCSDQQSIESQSDYHYINLDCNFFRIIFSFRLTIAQKMLYFRQMRKQTNEGYGYDDV